MEIFHIVFFWHCAVNLWIPFYNPNLDEITAILSNILLKDRE